MVAIHFGALCNDIKKQLHDQGYDIPDDDTAHLQKLVDAVILLKVCGIIPDSTVLKAEQKILKQIVSVLEKNV